MKKKGKDKNKEKKRKSAEEKKAQAKCKEESGRLKGKKNRENLKTEKKKKEKKRRETEAFPAENTAVRKEPEQKTASGKARKASAQLPSDQFASVFRALGDESRLRILEILRDQELCAADLLKYLPIVQSTLSHHMKILCESELVVCRRQGRWSFYTVNHSLFADAARHLQEWSGTENGEMDDV